MSEAGQIKFFDPQISVGNSQFIKKCEENFLDLYQKTNEFSAVKNTFSIEPVVHLIWLGKKSYPDYAKPLLKEWMDLNPEFQFILWVDEEENWDPFFENLSIKKIGEDFQLKFLQEEYDAHSSYAGKSDILRMELLYHFGGMYTDYDNRCLKNLKSLFTQIDFFSCFEFEETFIPIFGLLDQRLIDPRISNCLIGFKKQHPLVLDIIQRMKKAHEFFLKKNKAIMVYQIIYATYIHVTGAFFDYFNSSKKLDGIIFPQQLCWGLIRLKKKFPPQERFFEINFLPSVGWFGQLYEQAGHLALLSQLGEDN